MIGPASAPLPSGTAALPRNIRRDLSTVEAMIRIYCRETHATGVSLCRPCADLLEYATARLARCPFGSAKTTCRECPIHCYRPPERALMKEVMRFAGPRMLWRHPVLALRHLWLDRQEPPPWPRRRSDEALRHRF